MNLNMQAFNINTLLGGLDKVRDVMGVYQQQLLLIVIVFVATAYSVWHELH